jgi:hypothetical protein
MEANTCKLSKKCEMILGVGYLKLKLACYWLVFQMVVY